MEQLENSTTERKTWETPLFLTNDFEETEAGSTVAVSEALGGLFSS